MTKQELMRNMQTWTGGGFITAKKLAEYLGVSDAYKVYCKYLRGLDRVSGKYYFIPDVAQRLMEDI